jgi:hypothetical protein
VSPLENVLIELMLDAVALEPRTGVNKFNDFTYGPTVAVRCQVVRMNKRTLDRAGRETTSTVQVILADPTLVVTVDDRLTLSDGTHPAIMEVLSAKDDEGDYYLEIRA